MLCQQILDPLIVVMKVVYYKCEILKLFICYCLSICLRIELWSNFPELTNPEKLNQSPFLCNQSPQRACQNLYTGQAKCNMLVLNTFVIDTRQAHQSVLMAAVDAPGDNDTISPLRLELNWSTKFTLGDPQLEILQLN